jgi:hypothetical protein
MEERKEGILSAKDRGGRREQNVKENKTIEYEEEKENCMLK